jgi:hypothetical protein
MLLLVTLQPEHSLRVSPLLLQQQRSEDPGSVRFSTAQHLHLSSATTHRTGAKKTETEAVVQR